MKTRLLCCAVIGLLCWTPVYAQSTPQDTVVRDVVRLNNSTARTAVDWASTGVVIGSLVVPCIHDRTWRCVVNEGLQVGSTVLSAELVKHFVHRTRPDGSDRKSFFSEHTAIACAATIRSSYWYICPSVAYMRMAADRHYMTDTLAGGFIGTLSTTIQWGGK